MHLKFELQSLSEPQVSKQAFGCGEVDGLGDTEGLGEGDGVTDGLGDGEAVTVKLTSHTFPVVVVLISGTCGEAAGFRLGLVVGSLGSLAG